MQVQVKHRLPCPAPVVQHRAIAGSQFALTRKFRGDELQLAEHGCVLRGCISQGNKMFPWTNEDVAGRLRLNVLECKNIRVLVNKLRRYFFFSNLAEQAVVHEKHPEFRVYNRELRVENFSSRLLDANVIRLVQSHHESLEFVAVPQLHGELLGGVRTWNSPDEHTVEMSGWRIIILKKNRLVAHEQAVAETLGVRPVRESPHLHGEVTNRGNRTGEQFDAHESSAGADHVQRHCSGARKIENAVANEWAAVDDADLHVAAVIQIRDAQDASKRQRAVRRHERVHVENFAICRAAPVKWDSVPGRLPLFNKHSGHERRSSSWGLRSDWRGGWLGRSGNRVVVRRRRRRGRI